MRTARVGCAREPRRVPSPDEIGPLMVQHLRITRRLLGELFRTSPSLTLALSSRSALQGVLVPAQVYVSAGLIGSIVGSIAASTGADATENCEALQFFIIAWLVLQVVPIALGVLGQVVWR